MKKKSKDIEKIFRTICFNIKVGGRRVLKDFDISSAQFDVLQMLYFKGPKRLSDISKKLGVTKSTTTGIVKRLENQGLLERKQSDDDKRVFVISIKDPGKKIIDKVINERKKLMKKVIADMNYDSYFIEKLEDFSKKLQEVTNDV
ncbi:MarR family transcriptional regulator [Tepiditoga spiralis]|uniref:MarR family transcriptional regulator n=1 Tax=Tepiditoga spiralis TaxID=2108365 RepID=A0A7G1G9F5_9BACT|nr:MarR family transcriptional regulator [Tepiditoga spiralis]BBE32136.1 MarR family transcriptional regulator [Tepiditoga spiralis]